jgi:hypothetical protein
MNTEIRNAITVPAMPAAKRASSNPPPELTMEMPSLPKDKMVEDEVKCIGKE